MKFDLERAFEQTSAKGYFDTLLSKREFIEIKPISNGTGQQNRYFHLIVGWFALEYGESVEYVKQIMIKKQICPDVFLEEISSKKSGEVIDNYRSWGDLTKMERKLVIDKFRNYASKEASIYLPEPSEQGLLDSIEIELEKNKQWL
jgi:hypothetical protein